MIVSRFLPLAKVAIRRDFLFGRRWSWMKTAVMGEKSDAVRILVKVWKSLLLPRSEFTFLDTYLGPGCGSIPSSFRFLIHSTDRRRDAVASVHLPFSLARWCVSSLSLRVLRRGRTWWQAWVNVYDRIRPLVPEDLSFRRCEGCDLQDIRFQRYDFSAIFHHG